MEFATEDHSNHLGSCAGDFLCSYMSTITGRRANQPLPMEINPRVVFERLFGGDGTTPEERLARLEQNTSILDAVSESVKRPLSAASASAIGRSCPNISTTSAKSSAAFSQAEKQRNETGIEAPPTPVGIPETWEEHVKLMFDLLALALQANMTRVVSFMMARELSTLQLSADRRGRRPSSGFAQQQRAGAGREEGQDRHLSPRRSSRSSWRS